MDEKHFAEIDVAMLYIEEARERAERATTALRAEGADAHLIEASSERRRRSRTSPAGCAKAPFSPFEGTAQALTSAWRCRARRSAGGSASSPLPGAATRGPKSEAQTFLNDLLDCYGTDRRAEGARFEERTADGFMDLFWPGVCIVEMKRPSEARRLHAARRSA